MKEAIERSGILDEVVSISTEDFKVYSNEFVRIKSCVDLLVADASKTETMLLLLLEMAKIGILLWYSVVNYSASQEYVNAKYFMVLGIYGTASMSHKIRTMVLVSQAEHKPHQFYRVMIVVNYWIYMVAISTMLMIKLETLSDVVVQLLFILNVANADENLLAIWPVKGRMKVQLSSEEYFYTKCSKEYKIEMVLVLFASSTTILVLPYFAKLRGLLS